MLTTSNQGIATQALMAAADAAALQIPPAWPLAASVAVNPYLGQTNRSLADTAALLSRVAGCRVTMPRTWYHERIASKAITDDDLLGALKAARPDSKLLTLHDLKTPTHAATAAPGPCPTIADLAADISGIDWPSIIAERFGAWAAGYFDDGQALWGTARADGAYMAWRATATHDLTPEIAGLTGFAGFVARTASTSTDAIAETAVRLGLLPEATQNYFHRLLMTLGGWAHYARYQLWQAQLGDAADGTIVDLLAIRLVWDAALLARYRDELGDRWATAMTDHARPLVPTKAQFIDTILQEACERAAQRNLDQAFRTAPPPATSAPWVMQAAFCIDVRSEVFRRALEGVAPQVQTLGFAGFFGLAAAHQGFASDVIEKRLPVLLNPGVASQTSGRGDEADQAARLTARASRAWGRFKLAAVSSFAFVEATGPIYVAKLVRDALGHERRRSAAEPAPLLDPAFDLPSRIAAANAILRGMSLIRDFSPLVLLVGHGANVVNNPHASALHCGACGGYPGDVNARLLAQLLNDREVRDGLIGLGIEIPAETRFVGALHDTTTDDVTLFTKDVGITPDDPAIAQARSWIHAAGARARTERALRLPRAQNERDILRRSRDWSEIRPEWGLAGCNGFIAAPRARTTAIELGGRVFLHDYDWRTDEGFGVLELIITAPVVVASWISLQYYGSSVAPDVFGGGNKLLHNVVGGIGVIEGNGGPLRAGLPWQSVQNGRELVHEPLRLTVCIEAPTEAITAILARHPEVRALFDNRWLHLFAMGEAGGLRHRYVGDLTWQAVDTDDQLTDLAA